MQRSRLLPFLSVVTLALVLIAAAFPAPQAPATRYEHMVLTADFTRGNPRIEMQTALEETDLGKSWKRVLEGLRKQEDWRAFPLANINPEAKGVSPRLMVFDYLGWQGWHLQAVRVAADLPDPQIEPRQFRAYHFTRRI